MGSFFPSKPASRCRINLAALDIDEGICLAYGVSRVPASRPEEVSQPKSRFLRSGEPRFLKAFK
jgi:hypothetical protein